MKTIDFLIQRASCPARSLVEPAPTDDELSLVVQAGLSAPDHGALRPWRILAIRGEARVRLGELFAEGARRRDPEINQQNLQAHASKPLRSPLILAVIANITPDHPKAPPLEQILSTGAAAQQMLLAADALGYGAIWLTGPYATDEHVRVSLGLAPKDELIGFLYLGTPSTDKPIRNRPAVDEHLAEWNGYPLAGNQDSS